MKPQSKSSAVWKCLGYALLFYICQYAAAYLAQLVILFSLTASGASMADAIVSMEEIYFSLISEIMTLSGLIFLGLIMLMQRKTFSEKNHLQKTSGSSVLSGILLGFACYIAANFLLQFSAVLPGFAESKESYIEQQDALAQAARSPLIELLYTCLLGPIVEELLFRGSILSTLKKSFSPKVAIVLCGAGFALFHGNLYQGVFTLPLGILLAYLTWRFDSILPAMGLHIAFNSTGYLMQIGDLFGFDPESNLWTFCYYAVFLFCLFAIPAGILLLRAAKEKYPKSMEKQSTQNTNESYPPYSGAETGPRNENERGNEMAAPEYIIVGLGNPGEKYESTRHNCGFMALDYIALRLGVTIRNLRFRALTAEAVIDGKKVLLMKPQTFMNSSGEAVREAASFYKIPPERILVIFDDISFVPGVFRIRKNGSAGGHNGIKSIIACLSSENFPRVKMGIGAPPPDWDLMNWVLGRFSSEELEHTIASMEDVYAAAKAFVANDLDRAAAQLNGKQH